MAKLGADVEHLDRLAQRFRTEGARLESTATQLTAAIRGVVWKGPDADAFRAEWSATMAPRLTSIADVVRGQGDVLARQSQQQRQSSDGGLAPVGCPYGPGPGGPGGSGADWWDGNGDVWADAHADGDASWDTANGEVHGDARFGARSGVGADGDFRFGNADWSTSGEGELFLGGRGEGRAFADVDKSGVAYGANAAAFLGLEGRGEISREFAGGLYGTTTGAEGQVGAGAEADASAHIGTNGVGAHFGAGAMFGASGEVSHTTSMLDGNITQGGTASLGIGEVGIGGGADLNWSLDEVSYDVDFGAALGLGFDLSVNGSFSPSGLADNAGDAFDDASDFVGGLLN